MNRGLLIRPNWQVPAQVTAFSTTRHSGVSESPYSSFNFGLHVGDDPARVMANREALATTLPPQLDWQWLDQVHSNDVVRVQSAGDSPQADALITSSVNLICCVQTADCLPVFLASKEGAEIAVVHAGWKGLASGIVENTVAAMTTPKERVVAWLGPAIGACHFEVGSEVRAAFLASDALSGLERCFAKATKADKYMADLYGIARMKLEALGVHSVSGGDSCTHCDEDKFYSYRRDGVTGRMLNAIYIEA